MIERTTHTSLRARNIRTRFVDVSNFLESCASRNFDDVEARVTIAGKPFVARHKATSTPFASRVHDDNGIDTERYVSTQLMKAFEIKSSAGYVKVRLDAQLK